MNKPTAIHSMAEITFSPDQTGTYVDMKYTLLYKDNMKGGFIYFIPAFNLYFTTVGIEEPTIKANAMIKTYFGIYMHHKNKNGIFTVLSQLECKGFKINHSEEFNNFITTGTRRIKRKAPKEDRVVKFDGNYRMFGNKMITQKFAY